MDPAFDLILRGGTVATPGGLASADVGVRSGRIVAIGDLGDECRRPGAAVRRPARAARRHRHPGALPRAGSGAQGGPRHRHRRGGAGRRHRGVRDAEHQAADGQRRGLSPTSAGAPPAAPGSTTPSTSAPPPTTSAAWRSSSACPAAPASSCSWAARPAPCWWPTTRASAGRWPTAAGGWRCTPRTRTRLRERFTIVQGGAEPAAHPQWRDVETAVSATRRLLALADDGAAAGPRPARQHRRGTGAAGGASRDRHRRGDAAAPDPGRARLLSRSSTPSPR